MKNKFLSLCVISGLLLIQGCSDKKEEQNEVIKKEIALSSVEINTLEKKTYPIWVDFSGKTQAVQNVNITSRVSGELKQIHFKSGQKVLKNDILFSIDKTEYETILAQKEALLQKNIASLKLSTASMNRYIPLVQKGLAPQEKLDQLVAEKKQLEATIKADKATVKEAKLNLKYCDVVATIDGDIGKRTLDIGNIINKGDKLANIVQTNSLYVNFSPSSKTVSLINKYKSQINPTVKVIIDSGNKNPIELAGKIDFIDTVSNQETDTVDIRAIIDNKDGILFAGTFVELKMFITDKIPLIALHPNTISQNQLGSYVLVIDENNKIITKQIKTSYSNKNLVIIEEGLNVGDKVVVSNITKLKNNQKVTSTEIANKIKF